MEVENKIPVELLQENPEVLRVELENRRGFPCKDFIPNIGQERFLKAYRQENGVSGDYPKTGLMLGGNGTGKTVTLAIFLAGCTLGKGFLHPEYFDYRFFDKCEAIRARRKLRIRIVCDASDVEETGSVYEQITQWVPVAQWSGKTSGNYYTKITIPAPDAEHYETVIDIKTHKQDKVSHAGVNLDLILFNEPPPKHIFNENKGRIRRGGYMLMFLTPLDLAGYLCDIIDAERPEGDLWVVECPIWDNCKDRPGTRGHLSERDILDQIRDWEATDPTEVPARELGKFQHLSGSIFKIFSEQVHVVDPMPIEPTWNIYQIVDPHSVKPAFAVWIAVTPSNKFYVIAEYPTESWNKLMSTVLTITDFGDEFRKIETGKHEKFHYIPQRLNIKERYGDPNMFKETQKHSGRSLQMEYYNTTGLWYTIENIDNSISVRIDRIKQLLRYDYRRPVDATNKPQLYIFSTCRNLIMALKYFSIKKSLNGGYTYGAFEETWECPIAALGYGVTTVDSWSPNKKIEDKFQDDYSEIEKGRNPNNFSDPHELSFAEIYSGKRMW